jgi:hypothetical protein
VTLKEIGAPDALPLLAHMTPEQIRYWIDLDTWDTDQFRPGTVLQFLELMQSCGQDRLAEWLLTLDPETIVLVLRAYGEVDKLDIFLDPMEESDRPPFVTFDGYYRYYIQDESFRPHLEAMLRILHTRDPERYGMILEAAYQGVSSEIQDEALRYRSGRLTDHGVPAFEDAVEIYRPLAEEEFHRLRQSLAPERECGHPFSVLYPVRWLAPDSLLRRALRSLAGHPEADAVRMELAALGNKVVVADGMEVSNPQYVKAALQKVSGILTLGLDQLGGTDEKAAADRILETWLVWIFRLGYTRIHRLKQRAGPLLDLTRFRWADRFFSLAGTPLEETLWGLTRPRPLFFEGAGPDILFGFREFQRAEDIRSAGEVLSAVEVLSAFFSGRSLTPEKIKAVCLEGGWGDRADLIRWSSVLQTLQVCKTLSGSETFRLLSPEELRAFLGTAFSREPAGSRRLDPAYTLSVVRAVLSETEVTAAPVVRILEDWIRAGCRQMEEELGGLDPDRVPDPRFVQSVCVRHPASP